MKYVLAGSQDWADEFNVHFFEILDERESAIYEMAKNTFGEWYDSFYFGTNEGWDNDFDYLDFTLVEITDEEAEVLNKCGITGEHVFGRLFCLISEEIDKTDILPLDINDTNEWLETADLEEIQEVFNELASILEDENLCDE